MRRHLFALLGVCLAARLAGAQIEPDPAQLFSGFSFTSRREPIEVTANHLDFDYKNRTTVFRGAVEVHQGDIVLKSDRLRVTYVEAEGQQKLSDVTAEGNVTILQGARRATGKRAVFEDGSRTLVLSGDAALEEGANRLRGDTIVVFPDESRMEVRGENSRVKLLLFPGQEKGQEKKDGEKTGGSGEPGAGGPPATERPAAGNAVEGSDGQTEGP